MDSIIEALSGPKEIVEKKSIQYQKTYLIKHVNSLTTEQKIELGQILIIAGKKSLLQRVSEGTAVNLDLAPPEVVNRMYNFVNSKLVF